MPADFLAAEPGGKTCGSISTVRSDATPAQPLPTCANCGSNLIAPAPSPARDEVNPVPAATLTREEALAAGLPVHPEAVGVNLYASTQMPGQLLVDVFPTPLPPSDAVGEAGKCKDCNGQGWYPMPDRNGEQEHVQCWRCDMTGVEPQALAFGDEVREAAEKLWHRLTPPASTTENGCLYVPAEDLETVLRALDARPGASDTTSAALEAERARSDGLARELATIDLYLDRRSTLDGLTRIQKIALALRVCEETDPRGEVARKYVVRDARPGGERGE